MSTEQTVLLDEAGLAAAVEKLSSEIANTPWDVPVVLVGLLSRGDLIARRIAGKLSEAGKEVSTGYLDISLYRDDLGKGMKGTKPTLRSSHLPADVDEARVILVDDVLFTGRTINAALNAVMDYGRPSRMELAVLVDRGGREMPIQPDYVGYTSCHPGARVIVSLKESDGQDLVVIA